MHPCCCKWHYFIVSFLWKSNSLLYTYIYHIFFSFFGYAGSSLLLRLFSRCSDFSLWWLLLLWNTGSRAHGLCSCGLWAGAHSIVVVHSLSCSMVCRIFLGQGSNLRLLHWQLDSLRPGKPLPHLVYPFICQWASMLFHGETKVTWVPLSNVMSPCLTTLWAKLGHCPFLNQSLPLREDHTLADLGLDFRINHWCVGCNIVGFYQSGSSLFLLPWSVNASSGFWMVERRWEGCWRNNRNCFAIHLMAPSILFLPLHNCFE